MITERDILQLKKQLLPTGRAFRVPDNGNFEKLLKGLAVEEKEVLDDCLSILDTILPDNDNFSEEDATLWEQRLGVVKTDTLANRKLAIATKMQFPGTIINRQNSRYLEYRLQQAGFNVKIFEDKDINEEISTRFKSSTTFSSSTRFGMRENTYYLGFIANFLDQSKEVAITQNPESTSYFYIADSNFGEFTIPIDSEREFRRIVLMVKPLHTVALLKGIFGDLQWRIVVTAYTDNLSSVSFFDDNHGLFCGSESGGLILNTDDGTDNIDSQTIGATVTHNSIFHLTELIAWVCSYNSAGAGQIRRTLDGGTTWVNRPTSGVATSITDIFFTDANNGWFITERKIYKTTNSGDSWTLNKEVSDEDTLFLNKIYFIDSNVGYVIGNDLSIHKTTNGGTSWSWIPASGSGHLLGIYFLDSDNGFICGTNGNIITTVDGGANWIIQDTFTTETLNSIYAYDEFNLFCCGDNGIILKTNNGGTTWTQETTGTTENLKSITFKDKRIAYCCGDNGTILKYSI